MGALTAGILVGYVFVVPGLGPVAIAGLLGVPLSTMLVYGFLLGPPTAVLTTFIYGRLLKYGLWNKAKDEVDIGEMHEESPAAADDPGEGNTAVTERETVENSPLYVSLLPILVALLLIAFGAVAAAAGLESAVIEFFGDPVFALFVGLLGAYLLAWRTLSNEQVDEAMGEGFNATGQSC